ncbi:MAG: UvrD-helicase domain-containing protein [Nitrospinae bacterium]|nr:UvrD-helicase domain-containing protein [Nitrospinota bacterium]
MTFSATLSAARFDAESLASELNERQLEAVLAVSGPVLIIAGAGSGKTRVITYRIARLINEGASPSSILALTFTNKAAAEMRERAAALLGARELPLWVSTFHSVCLRLLRRHADRVGYPKDFVVYDAQDQRALIKSALDELGLPEKEYPARQAAAMISSFKSRLKGPADAENELRGGRSQWFIDLFHRYEAKLSAARSMDFDDLLGKAVAMFRRDADLRETYQRRFTHILVDEFQDTNVVQYELIRLLLGPERNICVVGDDDQSIYRWRGATVENILHFEKDYPDARVILLEQNYRSTATILSAANAVVERNPHRRGKKLWTQNGGGEKITLYTAADEGGEAQFVAEQAARHAKREGASFNDVAVFYRTNSQSRAIEDRLRAGGIPYQVYGGLKFYDRKEVKDLLAYFNTALNHFDAVSFKRIINTPPRGIGAATVERIEAAARERGLSLAAALDEAESIEGLNAGAKKRLEAFREILGRVRACAGSMSAADALTHALEVTGYAKWLMEDNKSESLARMDNLTELVNAAADFLERGGDGSMRAFLDQAALVADADDVADAEGRGAVKLMTVHVSKGLEFPVVFVTGLEDNLFPHARSKDDPAQMQEERRLLYVAMTRAKRRLYLTHAQSRYLLGVSQVNRPSVFLLDLPRKSLDEQSYLGEYTPPPAPRPVPAPKPMPAARPVTVESAPPPGGLAVGMRVRHPQFEIGVVRDVEGAGEKSKITVYFPRYGAKKLVRKFANLEILG